MSGWQPWADNIVSLSDGAALYNPKGGPTLAMSGQFSCTGDLTALDRKARGEEVSAPDINGKKFMFIRKITEEDFLFKQGSESVVTMRGPYQMRVAIYVKERKAETVVTSVGDYVKPYVDLTM